eukprot:Colp12_sorted_trinity150504_noHs@27483
MSLNSGVSAPVALSNSLKSNRLTARIIQIGIVDGEFKELHASQASGSVEADYDKMSKLAADDCASYFFFKISDKWLFISWVPEGKLKVKDRMVHGSSTETIRKVFGENFIGSDLHLTTKAEFTFKYYKEMKEGKSEDALSKEEILKKEALAMEEQARKEMEAVRKSNVTTGSPSMARKFNTTDTTIEKPTNSSGIGGYHSVKLPLTPEAVDSLAKFKSGTANWLQLSIVKDNSEVDCAECIQISPSEIKARVLTTEPRFYVYSAGLSNVFLYCCPGGSPPKLRMAYSTAKPSVADALHNQGITIAVKLENSDPEEITHQYLTTEAKGRVSGSPAVLRGVSQQPSSPPSWVKSQNPNRHSASATLESATAKASKINTVGQQHPVYGLMSGDSPASGKKKIVMPPPGAYC